jgi:non-specific serine/threonine protein kinase/serine/threonine-protein kinase
VRELGRGGMGVVYEAVRADAEFERRVAVKLLPAGWSAPALADRFRFERRVLAGLDHPNIARLLDAGATDDGVPYYVMEFVDGRPIDAWCRDEALGVRQRVELLCQVCDAVVHAHQHLVIHRDLKPGNILVTPDGQPKLLDFGIATLVSDASAASAGLTRTGQHSFTIEYASPEQIRGERVTTATDVYSLGVLAYRLLADRPPYDLAGLAPMEAMRVACEVDPPPPSRSSPGASDRLLRGDLDNIILKALRKDPHARYASVAALGEDLHAWLEGRPVSATPATLLYRARRYAARHTLAVTAATAVAVALLAGGVATAWQARVARAERDKAQRRFAQVREFSRALLFDVHDALRPLPGATEPRRLLLDRAVQFLDGLAADAGDDVALLIELSEGYRRLGQVQGSQRSDNVGDTDGARRSFEAAARLADQAVSLAPASGPILNAACGAYDDLGSALLQAGELERADRTYERFADAVRRLEQIPAGDPRLAAAIAESHTSLGYFRNARGDRAGAKVQYTKAVQRYETLPAGQRARAVTVRGHAFALKRLGAILVAEGQLDEGERRYREALALDEAVVAQHPDNAPYRYDMTFSLTDLGLVARKRGDLATSEAMYRRALQLREEALAADPKNTRIMSGVVYAHGGLDPTLRLAGRRDEAEVHRRAALALLEELRTILGEVPQVQSQRAWGHAYLAELRLDAAEGASSRARAAALAEARHLLAQAEALARGIDKGPLSDPGFVELLHDQRARLARLARQPGGP